MTKGLAWAAGVLAVVVVGSGVYTTFRYRPDATGIRLGIQRLHGLAGIALAVVVVVGLAAFIWERLPARKHGLPAFGVVVVVGVLLGVEVALGWRVAWDQLALSAVPVDLDDARGILLRDLDVTFVLVGTREVSLDDFRRLVWLHVLVLPVLVAAGAGFVLWWTRRFAARGRDTR